MKKCPYCAEEIQDEAIVCRFCGRNLKSSTQPASIIAFSLALFSLIAWFYPLCGFPVSIIALLSTSSDKQKPKHWTTRSAIVLATIGLLLTLTNSALGAYMGFTGNLFPSSTPTRIATQASYIIQPSNTPSPATPTSKYSSCLPWSKVYTSMQGQYICVYGTIYSTNRSRFDFSPAKNSFFLMEQQSGYYYPNATSGKCVLAWGTVQVFEGKIPFIYITELFTCESWMH